MLLGVLRFLHYVADHARWCLIAGLIVPLIFTDLAIFMQSLIAEFVALLVFLAAFRIGHKAAFGGLGDLKIGLATLLVYQLIAPLSVIGIATYAGWLDSWTVIILILVLAAPAVSAAPNLLMILGAKPEAALRMLCLGTAAMPLTTIPIFLFLPFLGTPEEISAASLRLLLVIAGAGGLGFAVRHWLAPNPTTETVKAVDGISAIALAVIVVGLMAAVTPTLEQAPLTLLYWLCVAFGINFGLQILAYLGFRLARPDIEPAPYALIAGNRNVALFVVALGEHFSPEFLIFLGCYQFPMYLTPMLMRWLYHRHGEQSVD